MDSILLFVCICIVIYAWVDILYMWAGIQFMLEGSQMLSTFAGAAQHLSFMYRYVCCFMHQLYQQFDYMHVQWHMYNKVDVPPFCTTMQFFISP